MKLFSFNVDPNRLDALASLPGTVAEHIRRAIDEYLERRNKVKVSRSPSKDVV